MDATSSHALALLREHLADLPRLRAIVADGG
jgi:hypothetical protein